MAPLDTLDTGVVVDDHALTIAHIRAEHRTRRFAMKQQSKVDRAMESFIRRNHTDWKFDADEKERKAANDATLKIIKAARKSKKHELHGFVTKSDLGRAAFDTMREDAEKEMVKLAAQLPAPAVAFMETVPGFAEKGLATIVGETGDLSNYPTYKHLWSRLGYGCYGDPSKDAKSYAGSTWKVGSKWAGRKLASEEWVAHPFIAERYSLLQQIGESLTKKQLKSKLKTASGETESQGYYGEIYVARRAWTKINRPDWTPMHGKRDAERIMMKNLVRDLWSAWTGKVGTLGPAHWW